MGASAVDRNAAWTGAGAWKARTNDLQNGIDDYLDFVSEDRAQDIEQYPIVPAPRIAPVYRRLRVGRGDCILQRAQRRRLTLGLERVDEYVIGARQPRYRQEQK